MLSAILNATFTVQLQQSKAFIIVLPSIFDCTFKIVNDFCRSRIIATVTVYWLDNKINISAFMWAMICVNIREQFFCICEQLLCIGVATTLELNGCDKVHCNPA